MAVSGKQNPGMKKVEPNVSGSIRFDEHKIYWDYKDRTIVEIDLDVVEVIGENTNGEGPWGEDWLLIFVTKDKQWNSISLYADNRQELLSFLTTRFDTDFDQLFLTWSFEWASVVRYPKVLEGIALFKLVRPDTYKAPKNYFEKFMCGLGFGGFDTSMNIELSDEVQIHLQNICR